jgi:erythromycin esterase-like protein
MSRFSGFATAWLLVTTTAAAWALQNEAAVDWIRGQAIPLTTPEAGHGFEDMQPLKKVIGSARVVSLGEATHGSREFFQLKHRMLEFLAMEMGFSLFSIEANMPEAYRLNDYVLNGTGDPAQLLRGMYFWTWDTEEVLDMIRWMREFNKSGKGRVEFTGFDMQTPAVAAEIVRSFAALYEPDYAADVGEAAAQAVATSVAAAGNSFGVATGSFPVQAAAGKKVRYSGYIKTEGVTSGYAGLWWRVDGASGVLAFDNMSNRGATGSSDWKQYVIELPVDAGVKNINFGMLMPGDGAAWFDDLAIELDGQPYSDTSLFDLTFESTSPKGFSIGGNGYRVGLDPDVAHGGKQSLRMRRVAPSTAPAPSPPGPKLVASRWKDILAHLDAGRATYRASRATDRDIDWAVQNARVVLQSLQMRSNEVSRDRSMADNVMWILEHNPNTKAVLWAHNGHVATAGFQAETMGAVLRRMLGNQMLVFGFAFNQGSFQAIAQGGGGLKNFTVPPAQAGSLDATLAAANIPLFALDLRQAQAWFKDTHGSRQIGAMYPEGAPYALVASLAATEAFDAMLFVEKTTAARKNPGR